MHKPLIAIAIVIGLASNGCVVRRGHAHRNHHRHNTHRVTVKPTKVKNVKVRPIKPTVKVQAGVKVN
jgi:hypothetical protein